MSGEFKALGSYAGPEIVDSGLVLALDAGNSKSYPGTGTTWTDLSGNGNTGTLTNGPTYSSSNGGSIVFDGIDDYVTISDSATTNTFSTITLEVIVKYTTTNNQIIAQKWNYGINAGYGIELLNGSIYGYAVATAGNYAIVSTSSYPANNIYYMALTLNGATQTLYINGASAASNSGGGIPSFGGYAFTLGRRSNVGADAKLTGNIYLTKIYNTALTADQILQNYNALRGRFGL